MDPLWGISTFHKIPPYRSTLPGKSDVVRRYFIRTPLTFQQLFQHKPANTNSLEKMGQMSLFFPTIENAICQVKIRLFLGKLSINAF